MLSGTQKGVMRGAALAMAVSAASLAVAIRCPPFSQHTPVAGLDAWQAGLRWDLLLVVLLAGNIGFLANHRFLTPEDIDAGAVMQGSARAFAYKSALQNTLEQTVLALSVHTLWAFIVPAPRQGAAVAMAAVLFAIGRAFFWHGYIHGAVARSFGFGLTFYPSLIMLALTCFRIL